MEIMSVIKYEGTNDQIVWKHPKEDFNTASKLIVHESQEAIFLKNGQMSEPFKSGSYSLETKNIPFLRRIINLPTDGVSAFHCEVYFVNLVEGMNLLWGTDSKVLFLDKTANNHAFELGARGALSFRVNNSEKLLKKLVGTENGLSREELATKIRPIVNAYIKQYLPMELNSKSISIFELDMHMVEFSNAIKTILNEQMSNYGIELEQFLIENFEKPEKDPYFIKINELRGYELTAAKEAQLHQQVSLINKQTDVQKKVMDIDTEAYRRQTEGISSREEHQFTVMEKLAENEGSGSDIRNTLVGMGAGLGMMSGVAGVVNSTFSEAMGTPGVSNPIPNGNSVIPPVPIVNLKEEDPIPNEANNTDSGKPTLEQKIQKLKLLKENGLLSEAEFEESRQKLIKEALGD